MAVLVKRDVKLDKLPVLLAAFFLSGFSALLYQVVWQRVLGLFSGSDVRSLTLVTGAYLAGLGLGSLLGGLWADRLSSRRAAQVFGLCNLGIALFALLSPWLFYSLIFQELSLLAQFPVVVFIIVFLSLLYPTILMGVSLPLLSRALVRHLKEAAGLISLLFGVNTLGAGIGTLVAGWYLIGALGYQGTVYVGALLSITVAALALAVAPQFDADDQAKTTGGFELKLSQVPPGVWGWCLLVFASGFIAISLEVIWFRVLDILLESTAYVYAHLLAFVLIGYAIGSMLGVRFIQWVTRPRRVFLWIQGLTGLYSGAIIWGVALAMQQGWLANSQDRLTLLPALLLLPPNILIGFYFPVVQKAVQTDQQVVGQRVSLVEVSNIAGNTAGAILTGLVLLNFLGTIGAIQVILGLGLLFIGVLIWENFAIFRLPARIAAGLLALLLLLTLSSFPKADRLWSSLHGVQAGHLFITAEDASGVSAVLEKEDKTIIYANGHSQGDIPYLPTHVMLGALPALVHPDPQKVMVIGIGSGGTPYSVGVNPGIKEIVAVEIIGSELDVLETYATQARGLPLKGLFDNGRYNITIGDGRRELALTKARFDIIEADAILPWRSRSGLLYSREFFEAAREKLAEGGLMAQWMPTPRVKATFMQVFPYGALVGNEILLGSNSPVPYDAQAILARLEDPAVISHLERGGVEIDQFRKRIEAYEVFFWTPETPRESDDINTDLFPKDEYYLNNY
jgi:predicted membrane-bound spermidine synthase